jgi:hypothetical protein
MTGRHTAAERAAHPLARDVARQVAVEYGACIRPIQLRKTSLDTGEVEQVIVPCGATLASICPPCAERNKVLRAAQCREGWHLEEEPVADLRPPDDNQKWLVERRADLQAEYDRAEASGEDTAELDVLIQAVEDVGPRSARAGPPPARD